MQPADLPAPKPGQTYSEYVNAAVCAAAERWGRWRAERRPEPAAAPGSPAERALVRPSLLDFAAAPEVGA